MLDAKGHYLKFVTVSFCLFLLFLPIIRQFYWIISAGLSFLPAHSKNWAGCLDDSSECSIYSMPDETFPGTSNVKLLTPGNKNNHRKKLPSKKVHQLWKTEDLTTYSNNEHSHHIWTKYFKPLGWEVKLWTDEMIDKIVKEEYSFLWELYSQKLKKGVMKADLARLLIVHREGGIYADLDAYPILGSHFSSFKDWENELFNLLNAITNDPPTKSINSIIPKTSEGWIISNHAFFARKGDPFLMFCLQNADRFSTNPSWIPYLQVFYGTGPLFFYQMLKEYHKSSHLSQTKPILLLGDSKFSKFIIHKAGRSWLAIDGRFLNWLVDRGYLLYFVLVLGIIFFISIYYISVLIRNILVMTLVSRKTRNYNVIDQ